MTDHDILKAASEFHRSPKMPDMRYQLVDFREVTKVSVTSDAIRELACLDRDISEKNPDIKMALVLKGALMTRLVNMWDMSGGGTNWQTKTFEDEVSAREWLGIEGPT